MTYTLYWRTGKREVLKGKNLLNAMRLAGYGGGASRALDFHVKGVNTNWTWNTETREWDRKKED